MSKELEALNIAKATEKYTGIDLSIIKNALLKAQEQEKILSILKESPFILQRFFEYKGLKNQDAYDENEIGIDLKVHVGLDSNDVIKLLELAIEKVRKEQEKNESKRFS